MKNKIYISIIKLTFPIVIQTIINTLLSMVDVLMVGQLGESSITAVSLGNSWFFICSFIITGITSSGAIFMAQYYGSGDKNKFIDFFFITFFLAIVTALVMVLFSIVKSDFIMGVYSKDIVVIKKGSNYVKIIGGSFIIYTINNIFQVAYRSRGNMLVGAKASIIAVFSNIFLDYLLILGIVKWEIVGAAIATLISRIIEFFCLILLRESEFKALLEGMMRFKKINQIDLKEYIKCARWIIIGETIYSVGSSMYNIAYRYYGTNAQAALQILLSITSFCMVTAIGIGNASASILGNLLGKNQIKEAKQYSKYILKLTIILALCMGSVAILILPNILFLFNVNNSVKSTIIYMIYIYILVLPIRSVNLVMLSGILRSGGISKVIFEINIVSIWILGLPCAFLGAKIFEFPIYITYLFTSIEEIGKFVMCLYKYRSYEWTKNITNDIKIRVGK